MLPCASVNVWQRGRVAALDTPNNVICSDPQKVPQDSNSQPRLQNNRYAGLFRAYTYPVLVPGVPGGYQGYPDPLRGGFVTVVMNSYCCHVSS